MSKEQNTTMFLLLFHTNILMAKKKHDFHLRFVKSDNISTVNKSLFTHRTIDNNHRNKSRDKCLSMSNPKILKVNQ